MYEFLNELNNDSNNLGNRHSALEQDAHPRSQLNAQEVFPNSLERSERPTSLDEGAVDPSRDSAAEHNSPKQTEQLSNVPQECPRKGRTANQSRDPHQRPQYSARQNFN